MDIGIHMDSNIAMNAVMDIDIDRDMTINVTMYMNMKMKMDMVMGMTCMYVCTHGHEQNYGTVARQR
jgi:hypothetical protein